MSNIGHDDILEHVLENWAFDDDGNQLDYDEAFELFEDGEYEKLFDTSEVNEHGELGREVVQDVIEALTDFNPDDILDNTSENFFDIHDLVDIFDESMTCECDKCDVEIFESWHRKLQVSDIHQVNGSVNGRNLEGKLCEDCYEEFHKFMWACEVAY